MKTNLTVTCVILAGLALAAGELRATDDSSARHNKSSYTTSGKDMNQQVCASKIIGQTVKNDQNQTLGEVKDLVMDSSSTVRYAVISTGGAAGLGAKKIAVPIKSLSCSHDGNVTLSATKEDLKAASQTPQGTWAAVQGQPWTKDIDGFYGQPMAISRFDRDSAEALSADQESVRSKKAAPQTLNILEGEAVGNDYKPKMKSDLNLQETSADMALKNQIHQKLEKNYTTDQLNSVRLTVNNGVVILSGSVADQADRNRIENQVKAVPGVNQVDNQLTVRN